MLTVEFESEHYNGSESSGIVEVVILLLGGLSTTSISVMVITTEQITIGERLNSYN